MSNVTPSPPEAAVEPRAPPLTMPAFLLNLMRGGVLLIAVGLVVVEWLLVLQQHSCWQPSGNSVLLASPIIAVNPREIMWKRYIHDPCERWTRVR